MTESFRETEARIAVIQRRSPGYPAQLVTLMRLTVHLQKRLQDRYNATLRSHDLSFVTYNALMMIYGTENEQLRVSRLAAATGEKAANVTRICDDLVARQLIRRAPDPQDRRAVVLCLTARGRRLLETVSPKMWALLKGSYAPFSPAQLDTLEKLLRQQLGAMEQDTP